VIAMPPLRDRGSDVILLAEILLRRLAAEYNKTLSFSEEALKAVETYRWPGNVRELENRLRNAAIMVEGRQLTPQDLSLGESCSGYEVMGLNKAREAVERDLIERTIARNRGNLTRCADELQVARSSLYELIEKVGISRKWIREIRGCS
jgi:two-component system NtrC family response regulator